MTSTPLVNYLFVEVDDIEAHSTFVKFPSLNMQRSEDIFPITIFACGHSTQKTKSYYYDDSTQRQYRHHVLQYTVSGFGFFEYEENGEMKKKKIGEQTMFIASHDMHYKYYFNSLTPWEFVFIVFTGEYADKIISHIVRTHGPVLHFDQESTVIQSLKELLFSLYNNIYYDEFALSMFAFDFSLNLYKHVMVAGNAERNMILQKTMKYILENIDEVGLEDLARLFGYTKKYFNSYFKNIVGITPHDCILRTKIQYSMKLLINSNDKVKEVANRSGFSEENYFSKVFKKYIGYSPKQFRELHRKEGNINAVPIMKLLI